MIEAATPTNPFTDYDLKPKGCEMGYKVEPGFNDLPYHTWWIKDGDGGVHVWARQAKLENWPTEWIGGVEVHYAVPPSGRLVRRWRMITAPCTPKRWRPPMAMTIKRQMLAGARPKSPPRSRGEG